MNNIAIGIFEFMGIIALIQLVGYCLAALFGGK